MPVRKAGPSPGRSKLLDMPTKSQDIDRVDEVVEVALRLFLERGYDNTPMSLLAKKLGLTKAGIYHHFASKEDLFLTMLDEHFATVTGNYHLERTAVGGGNADGYFLLVVEKTSGGWKIVRDATTNLPKKTEK